MTYYFAKTRKLLPAGAAPQPSAFDSWQLKFVCNDSMGRERRCGMTKKTKYTAPKVVGSASVHPC